MTRGLDTATGSTDLAWNLVQLFFLTTVLAARPGSAADEAVTPGAEPDPVVVTLIATEPPRFALPDGSDPSTHLAVACAESGARARLMCPEDLPHGRCRAALRELARTAQGCRWAY